MCPNGQIQKPKFKRSVAQRSAARGMKNEYGRPVGTRRIVALTSGHELPHDLDGLRLGSH